MVSHCMSVRNSDRMKRKPSRYSRRCRNADAFRYGRLAHHHLVFSYHATVVDLAKVFVGAISRRYIVTACHQEIDIL